MPLGCVIRLLCRNVEPGLRLHVLLALTTLLNGQLVQLVVFNDLCCEFGLFLYRVRDRQVLKLLQDVYH